MSGFKHPLTVMAVEITGELRAERRKIVSILPRVYRRRYLELVAALVAADGTLADIANIDPGGVSLDDILDACE